MSNKPIFVTGHKSPDTDSFCAAISYAYYKQQKGMNAQAICPAGPNKETSFVLDYFKVEQPQIVKDFYVKVNDIMVEVRPLEANATLDDIIAWKKEYKLNRIPVVENGKYLGLIQASSVANLAIAKLEGQETDVLAKDIADTCKCLVVDVNASVRDLDIEKTKTIAAVDGEKYVGMVPMNFEMPAEKQKVILVDHNEAVQIIDGIEEAEIFENVDHHRIGGLTTEKPIFIHYEPVGCTCTIIANFFRNDGMDIPKHIAGLMLSAIISDTVLFRSPTCTEKDIETAKFLANVAGLDLEVYGMEMLKAGADVSDLTHDQIVRTDMKEFTVGDKVITIAQISLMDTTDVLAERAQIISALESLREEGGYTASYIMITNILEESTTLLYSGDADAVVTTAFGQAPVDNGVYLAKTMSRKKQIVPPVVGAMK